MDAKFKFLEIFEIILISSRLRCIQSEVVALVNHITLEIFFVYAFLFFLFIKVIIIVQKLF